MLGRTTLDDKRPFTIFSTSFFFGNVDIPIRLDWHPVAMKSHDLENAKVTSSEPLGKWLNIDSRYLPN